MNELKSNKKFRPPNKVKDAASLNSLLGFLNDNRVTGAIVPKGEVVNAIPVESSGAAAIKETSAIERPTPAQLPVSSPTAAPTPEQPPVSAPTTAPINLSRVCYTGRLMSGKDFVSAAAGQRVFSIAEPLYALQKLFFGTDDKTIPGARNFLQVAGQIGRNEINAAYPLSIERANFIALVREQANRLPDDFSVDWPAFGRHSDLWLDAMLCRVRKHLVENPGARVAVTNARFNNELSRLTAEGFVHFHCMVSAATWSARLQKVGLLPESPATKDISEQLAAALDGNVVKTLSKAKQGVKLKCIWSDDKQPPPSQRLLTVPEFCALFPKI